MNKPDSITGATPKAPVPQQLRKAFIQTFTKMAEKDPRMILVIGDVGFSFLEDFIKNHPNQYLNAGIGEQNMMGMCSGLALAGWKPYVYTMTNFILLRPLEQLRNDICYTKANVKVFGVKGGPSYKFLGMSHNMTDGETRGILENLPNINTYAPELESEVERIMQYEYENPGPSYMQI